MRDPNQSLAGRPKALYDLVGTQVEPEAGYWSEGPPSLPRVVSIEEVLNLRRSSFSAHKTLFAPRFSFQI